MCVAVKEKLDKLANLQERLAQVQDEKQKALDDIMAPVLEAIKILEDQYQSRLAEIENDITFLDADIRSDVLQLRESVKGTFLHAVFSKGRVSWNDDKLLGYAIDHPEILEFRSESKPSVAIRKVELKEGK